MPQSLRQISIACIALAACLLSIGAKAYRPIDSKQDLTGVYPTWPTVEYGTGDKAKLIKRGEYLAKAGDCVACHTDTEHQGKQFAGGLAIKTPFGTFYTPNITPDKKNGIGTWSEKDFIRAMHEGKRADGANNFPVFPYLYYTRVSDNDLRAIWAYMKAVPPVAKPNKKLPFPFNMPGARLGLYGWKMLFFYKHKGVYKYEPSQSKEWNRGKYLVDGLGHCGMCHTPLNPLGAPKWKYYLNGGFVDGYWAPNITSWGLKGASRFEVSKVFVEGRLIHDAGNVAGPMAEVNHDSLKFLNEADRLAIATYLKSVPGATQFDIKTLDKQPTLKRGRQVFYNVCTICHQEGKAGAPVIGDDASWMQRSKQGLNALYRHAINGYNNMPPKGACVTCSDNDIKAGVHYILERSLSSQQYQNVLHPKKTIKQTFRDGHEIYSQYCAVCHQKNNVYGGQVVGDEKIWSVLERKKGVDNLIYNTLRGYRGMPKMGGCTHCSNSEVKAAVVYMLQQSIPGKNFSLWLKR